MWMESQKIWISSQVRFCVFFASMLCVPAIGLLVGLCLTEPIAVEFNEDLSALHGPTLDTEIEYTSRAISYILSLYPPNTSIIVMGHSMGGIVATSLLPSANISAIITMSTPHTLPPARFDSRIDKLYAANQRSLLADPTPILSLCGGATDSMIVSESCVLPSQGLTPGIYRKTIFTSAMEGAWTGVGHREMVWCDQVRSQVARAALALGIASSNEARAAVLDGQLRDGLSPPPTLGNPAPFVLADPDAYEALSAGAQLVLNHPQGSRMYLLPVTSQTSRLVLLISQGSMPTMLLHSLSHLRVSVHFCEPESSTNAIGCSYQQPTVLKLIPNPAVGEPFPRPDEGVSESESIVLFEADIPPLERDPAWVGVLVESASGDGWVVAGLEQDVLIRDEVNILSTHFSRPLETVCLLVERSEPFFEDVLIPLRSADKVLRLRTKVHLPTLISSSLVVYKATPLFPVSTSCPGISTSMSRCQMLSSL
jgi:GPI inositol-deacylase